MTDNLYAPPMSMVHDAPAHATADTRFFVIAPRKFLLLFFLTFGFYRYVWWWAQWSHFRRATKQDLWPVARAVFSIFFAHPLNNEIEARRRPGMAAWSPGLWATVYVVAVIAERVADRLLDKAIGELPALLAGIGLLLPVGLSLLRTQQAANEVCGDAGGTGNACLSGANVVWMVLGALAWLVVIAGAVIMVTEA